jgi:hypothetical protein
MDSVFYGGGGTNALIGALRESRRENSEIKNIWTTGPKDFKA